ncbi:GTP cyclohydrolase IIa [Carboxydochorda subterranea]|uniref:GTP cyclohydrolase IIa n=1 Tax=Carboxydichorda subterranea TaxID=3109565 RepID=A0ABZ1BUT0_9FIRM|nr:GTP cyclohydrolase IIa [Limnochorda sp. L945t]WRP16571.1 GTP cyclohydrolase IIa [Limnochorda sp. L945t]
MCTAADHRTPLPHPIAVIGPEDIVARVMGFAADFEGLQAMAAPYVDESQAPGLALEAVGRGAEVLLFTGPVPYARVVHAATSDAAMAPLGTVPKVFVQYTGSSLTAALLQAMAGGVGDVRKASLDTLSATTVTETYEEAGLDASAVVVHDAIHPVEAEPPQVAAFHEALWKAGRTSLAVTCRRSVWRLLQEGGVPSVCVTPTASAIREALELALARAVSRRSREQGIAVGVVNVDRFESFSRTAGSEYRVQLTKLRLHRLLLDFAEELQATLVFTGHDEFVLVATRGAVESATHGLSVLPILAHIRQEVPVTVSMGWGFGETARMAELNARAALRHAKARGGNCGIVLLESGEWLGPLGETQAPVGDARPAGAEAPGVASRDEGGAQAAAPGMRQPALTAKSLGALRDYAVRTGRRELTSREAARVLGVTERSARRSLARLERSGLAVAIGSRRDAGTSRAKGRPMLVYRLVLPREALRQTAASGDGGGGVP